MKWMITGISGQDGSYISEILLERGDNVCAIMRRTSDINDNRFKHLLKYEETGQLEIRYADLLDEISLRRAIEHFNPDIIVNLAAQSHVGISFDNPISTIEYNMLGPLKLLEIIRSFNPKIKYYQASSSEMFGISEPPQDEETPMLPQSPYGIAKLGAYHLTRLYRNAYGIHASNGILFNHESVPKNSPIIVKSNKGINILPIEDLFKSEKHRYEQNPLKEEYIGKQIWNGEEWTEIISGSCYKKMDKKMKLVQTVSSCYEATNNHVVFDIKNKEKKTKDIKVGDKLFNTKTPPQYDFLRGDEKLATFIGFVVGDGSIDKRGRITLIGKDRKELEKIYHIVYSKFGWGCTMSNMGPGNYDHCKKNIWNLKIHNDTNWGKWLRKEIYTQRSHEKKVPEFILNSSRRVKQYFFDGYYAADGRKKGNETYEYKGFTTKSATLCLGLLHLFRSFSDQVPKVKCEYPDNRRYYYVQFRSDKETKRGEHLKKDLNQVVNIIDTKSEDGWFFDLQTESQTFATGPNITKVHNSPRRGFNFVTRKITMEIAKIVKGDKEYMELGNLEAKRDWGFSREYMEAVIKIMELDEPVDVVIATDETYSIKEFLEEAFNLLDLDWKEFVKTNDKYKRPAEVPALMGVPDKAKKVLDWEAGTKFKKLVKMMLESDLQEIAGCDIEEARNKMKNVRL